VQYCPYGKDALIRLMKEGKIRGGRIEDKKTRPYFFDRISIDEHMASMCDPEHEEIKIMAQKSLAKLRSVK